VEVTDAAQAFKINALTTVVDTSRVTVGKVGAAWRAADQFLERAATETPTERLATWRGLRLGIHDYVGETVYSFVDMHSAGKTSATSC